MTPYERTKAWREAHPGSRAEEARQWRAAHPDVYQEIRRRYRESHQEEIRQRDREAKQRQRKAAVIFQTAVADGRGVEIVIEQEPGASGKSQIDALVAMLAGFRVSGRRNTGDKLTRAGPLASQAEAGNVRLLAGPWVAPFLDELEAFPSPGVHDDQVDAASGAFLALTQVSERPGVLPVSRAVKGWQPASVRAR